MSKDQKPVKNFAVQETQWGSERYRALLALREDILRKPLGLSLCERDIANEKRQHHFGIWDEGQRALAYGIGMPLSESTWRVRQMAVRLEFQNRGLGQSLVSALAEAASRRRVGQLVLHARIPAISFYEKQGFTASGEIFEEVGLPHLRMERSL